MKNKKGIYAPISVILSTKFMSCFLASGGFAPRPHRGSAPGPRWGTSVPRLPHHCPNLWPPSSFRL